MKQKIVIELEVEFDLTAAGEFDDSAQHILETELMKYQGVIKVETQILSPIALMPMRVLAQADTNFHYVCDKCNVELVSCKHYRLDETRVKE